MIIANVYSQGMLIPVEVQDVIKTGDGRLLASVRAMTGQPFTQWTHGGPVYTDSVNVSAGSLQNVTTRNDPQPLPAGENLLHKALAYQDRKQWQNGESIPLVTGRNGQPLAFLKNVGERVLLYATGAKSGLPVYLLHPDGWHTSRTVADDYPTWAATAKATLAGAK